MYVCIYMYIYIYILYQIYCFKFRFRQEKSKMITRVKLYIRLVKRDSFRKYTIVCENKVAIVTRDVQLVESMNSIYESLNIGRYLLNFGPRRCCPAPACLRKTAKFVSIRLRRHDLASEINCRCCSIRPGKALSTNNQS